MRVHVVFEERYWYPDDGGQLWLSGYSVVEEGSGRFIARESPELAEMGVRVTSVAGAAAHHAEALASDEVRPGQPVVLRRDPDNEHDPNAIAADTPSGEQLGWVPRELAEELAPELDGGRDWSAVVLRESRPSPRDPRTGLTMLLAPERVELVVGDD